MAVKRLVLTSSSPGRSVFHAAIVLIEPRHLRQDKSHPGDVYAIGNGMHMKDFVMDIIITFAIKSSCQRKERKKVVTTPVNIAQREACTRGCAKGPAMWGNCV